MRPEQGWIPKEWVVRHTEVTLCLSVSYFYSGSNHVPLCAVVYPLKVYGVV